MANPTVVCLRFGDIVARAWRFKGDDFFDVERDERFVFCPEELRTDGILDVGDVWGFWRFGVEPLREESLEVKEALATFSMAVLVMLCVLRAVPDESRS
jgi:hypothetical protein